MDCIRTLYQFLCCIDDPKYPNPYNFSFGTGEDLLRNSEIFESNFVRTSKYRWYDFVPKSLLLQFKRLANIYFLVISILCSIPIISPIGPVTAWAPLGVVLGISMIRQGYEDYQRYLSDKRLNQELLTRIYRDEQFVTVKWSQVKIGDIVMIMQGELLPVDMILLASSIQGGNAFIKTASLDGENNLKPRTAFPQTQKYNSQQSLKGFGGLWEGIPPDKQLHNFSSKLQLWDKSRITFHKDKQLLYRGSSLENTKWIYGLSIYTGRNSKIMMNSDSSSEKMSQIEVKVNYILGFILIIQIILCIIVAILNGVFINRYSTTDYYINWSPYSIGADSALIWCTYFVLLNTMIPISLIVSIEMVKVAQSYFINKDQLMYSQMRHKGVQVKSASLNEQLGQIEYIFTDKTGTLTMNKMQFKIAVIGNRLYGDLGLVYPSLQPIQTQQAGFHDNNLTDLLRNNGINPAVKNLTVRDRQGEQQVSFRTMRDLAHEYLTALAIAHEVVSEINKQGQKHYEGPSPDEITLVDAARKMGYQFDKSTQTTTQIIVQGQTQRYDLLQVFPFNSDRKRMSVVIKSGGLIKMYIKGADSIIKKRLAKDQEINLDKQLTDFSKIGLRTLLIGMRIISVREYNSFRDRIKQLPPSHSEQQYGEIVSQLQQNIYLIGATAVLDRLQDQVPETIRDLIKANIKIWMLTGDKMQTAENIAKSCNLIQNNFHILRYECKEKENALTALNHLSYRAMKLSIDQHPKAFLIEGEDLSPIIGNFDAELQLANLSKYCQTVICCRMLPIQKAEVVRIVRTKLNKVTLSIGDGSNDVPMIKTAHIGVGLFGQEGMGAVQACDYALPQFRMLWRLLLVHGRWNYIRISQMILYFFYKNMLFTIPQFIFAFYCGFSGQTIFDDYYISLYNLFFTSIPLVVRAILEQDIYYVRPSKVSGQLQESNMQIKRKSKEIKKMQKYIPKEYEINKYLYRLFPKIYFIGQQNSVFNYTNFVFWIVEGFVQATMITLFCLYIFSAESLNSNGASNDLWLASLTMFTSIILVVTFKLSTHTKFWSLLLFISIIVLSLGLYVAYMWMSNYYFSDYVKGTPMTFYTNAQPYFLVIFCICFVLLIDGIMLTINFNRGSYASKMRTLIQEQKQYELKNYKQISIHSGEIKTQMPAI